MKLHEYQAKQLLEKAGIPTPRGQVASSSAEAQAIAKQIGLPVAIKAQVLVGGRGKAGGIKVAKTPDEAKTLAEQILSMKIKGLPVKKVLVEQGIEIDKEYYLGITVDRALKSNVLIFSEVGGIDIEEVARTAPDKITKITLTPSSPLPQGEGIRGVREIADKLRKIYFEVDATLAEINPLVKTKNLPAGRHGGKFIAADAKVVIDDNALFRHEEFAKLSEESEEDEIEAEAHRRKIAYVRLKGNIGIIGNGAGLVMSTMDSVVRAGGAPASFLDIGGGARADLVKNALEILLMDKNIKGIFFNVFGGITRCDEVALGIIEALKTLDIKLPIVVRLTGTREEEGRNILSQTKLETAVSMQEGAKKIVERIN